MTQEEVKIVFYFEMPVCRFSPFPTDTLASHLILYLMPKCDKKKKKKTHYAELYLHNYSSGFT